MEPAEKLAHGAISCESHPSAWFIPLQAVLNLLRRVLVFQSYGPMSSLPPVYALLANIQIARARKAPKLILPEPSEDFAILKFKTSSNEGFVQGRMT